MIVLILITSWTTSSKKIMIGLNIPTNIYLLKVSNRNTSKICDICSRLTIKKLEWRQWRHSGVFIVNFKHIFNTPFGVFLLLTLSMYLLTSIYLWAGICIYLRPCQTSQIRLWICSKLLRKDYRSLRLSTSTQQRFVGLQDVFNTSSCNNFLSFKTYNFSSSKTLAEVLRTSRKHLARQEIAMT